MLKSNFGINGPNPNTSGNTNEDLINTGKKDKNKKERINITEYFEKYLNFKGLFKLFELFSLYILFR